MSVLVFPFDSAVSLTGLTSGDTYDATTAAANTAVLAAACSAGGYYRVPDSGTYRVATSSFAANVTKPTIIAGPRSGYATFKSGPDSPLASSTMFLVTGVGSLTLLGNIEIAGAPNVSYGTDPGFADTIPTYGVLTQDATSLDVDDGVKFSDWITCIKMDAGGSAAIRNATIGGRVVSILAGEISAPSSLLIDNCAIALGADNGQAIGQVHNIYSSRGVDLSVSRSSFTRAGRTGFGGYGILCGYGGSRTPVATRKVSNCRFSGISRPVYAGSTGLTRLENCYFNSSADTAYPVNQFTPAGAFECVGSTFIGQSVFTINQYAMLDDQNTLASGTFTGCNFSGAYTYVLRRLFSGSTGLISLNQCSIGSGALDTALGSDPGCGRFAATQTDFGLLVGDLADYHPNPRVSLVNCTRGGANPFSGNG